MCETVLMFLMLFINAIDAASDRPTLLQKFIFSSFTAWTESVPHISSSTELLQMKLK